MGAHEDQPLLLEGPEFRDAGGLLIMLHGRGSTARDIMNLSAQFRHEGLAFAAPQADGKSWFPYSFLVSIKQNQPGVPSAMTVIKSLVLEADLLGIPPEKVMILGFSQGACLALEFAARNPARYGGVFALSGGLMGPPGTTWESEESLSGTPIFIGCSDVDPHIPRSRIAESGEVLTRLGAEVTLTLYPGMGHTISGAELEHVNTMIAAILAVPVAPRPAPPDRDLGELESPDELGPVELDAADELEPAELDAADEPEPAELEPADLEPVDELESADALEPAE